MVEVNIVYDIKFLVLSYVLCAVGISTFSQFIQHNEKIGGAHNHVYNNGIFIVGGISILFAPFYICLISRKFNINEGSSEISSIIDVQYNSMVFLVILVFLPVFALSLIHI